MIEFVPSVDFLPQKQSQFVAGSTK